MGTFHVSITDKAVLDRVRLALKKGVDSLDFKVPKAKKEFKLTIVTSEPAPDDTCNTPVARFTLREITNNVNVKELK